VGSLDRPIPKISEALILSPTFEAWVYRDGRLRDPIVGGGNHIGPIQNWLDNSSWNIWSDLLGNPAKTSSSIGYIAVGTGSSAFSANSTALTTEFVRLSCAYAHTSAQSSFTETTTFGQATFATTGTSVAESATFTQSSGGNFFSAITFTNLTLFSSDSLQIVWTFNLSGS